MRARLEGRLQAGEGPFERFSDVGPNVGAEPKDAWETPFVMERALSEDSTRYRLTSFGQDRIVGTRDDLTVEVVTGPGR